MHVGKKTELYHKADLWLWFESDGTCGDSFYDHSLHITSPRGCPTFTPRVCVETWQRYSRQTHLWCVHVMSVFEKNVSNVFFHKLCLRAIWLNTHTHTLKSKETFNLHTYTLSPTFPFQLNVFGASRVPLEVSWPPVQQAQMSLSSCPLVIWWSWSDWFPTVLRAPLSERHFLSDTSYFLDCLADLSWCMCVSVPVSPRVLSATIRELLFPSLLITVAQLAARLRDISTTGQITMNRALR